MKKTKLFILASLALTTSLVLGACSSSGKSGSKSSAKAADKKISIMAPFIETEPPSNTNKIIKGLEKITKKDINITWVPNTSYSDKVNVTLASNKIPDLIVESKSGSFVKSAKNGAFWDLTDYLKDYPNLSKADPDIQKNASINGKVYGVYRGRDVMRTAVIIRKDWLKNLGLEEPKSVDDLYDLAKAFTENDPDGNGKKDTYGIVIPKWEGMNNSGPYDAIATWFGAGNAWKKVSNNKLQPTFMNQKYLDSMNYVKKMVDNGYINKDFATLSTDKWNDAFVAGKGGIIIDTYSRAGAITSVFKTKSTEDYGDYVTITGNLTDKNGKLNALPTDGYNSFLAIPKASVKTEKELKVVLSFLDKMNSKKANILMNNGIEGVNFKLDDDGLAVAIKPETDEIKEINTAIKSYSQLSMGVNLANKNYSAKPDGDVELETFKKRQDLMASDAKHAVFNPAASIVTDTYASKGVQLDQIIGDARLKYVAGQIDEKGWNDAISLWKKSGGSDLISETNKAFSKMSD